jgi:hypothetical protein
MVGNLCVMTDVSTLHEEVVIADDRLATSVGSPVDDYILTDDVIIANNEFTLLATKLEVLWQSTQYRTLMNLVVRSHASTVQDAYEWEYDAIVSNDYIIFDIDERKYLAIVADSRFRRNLSSWTYFACHNIQNLIYFAPPPSA